MLSIVGDTNLQRLFHDPDLRVQPGVSKAFKARSGVGLGKELRASLMMAFSGYHTGLLY